MFTLAERRGFPAVCTVTYYAVPLEVVHLRLAVQNAGRRYEWVPASVKNIAGNCAVGFGLSTSWLVPARCSASGSLPEPAIFLNERPMTTAGVSPLLNYYGSLTYSPQA